MKKAEKYIYLVIILILVVVVACAITYAITISKNNNESTNEQTNNNNSNNSSDNIDHPDKELDSLRLINTREKTNQVIQEYEIVLNGKKDTFEVNFDIEDQTGYFEIKATIGDENVFKIMNDFEETPNDYIAYINNYFNEDNFIIFPGVDGINYLIVKTFFLPPANGIGIDYNFYNQDFDFIGKLDFIVQGQGLNVEDDSIFYDTEGYEDKQVRSKIEGNKIYNLYFEGCEPGNIEERRYTIENNQLKYEVIGTYSVLGVAGAC